MNNAKANCVPNAMRLAKELELRVRPTGGAASCGEVWIAGRRTGAVVSGCVLEAAVRCELGWFLFVTDDIPYEEALAIHFLDDRGRLLDSAYIGGPYTTGSFSNLRLEPPATVHFSFIDDAEWRVRALPEPRYAVPWWPDARGVWRDGQIKRRFKVYRETGGRVRR